MGGFILAIILNIVPTLFKQTASSINKVVDATDSDKKTKNTTVSDKLLNIICVGIPFVIAVIMVVLEWQKTDADLLNKLIHSVIVLFGGWFICAFVITVGLFGIYLLWYLLKYIFRSKN